MTDRDIREQVHKLLLQNTVSGYSRVLRLKYNYVRPSPGTYPFQWFWDTCFHAFMLCSLGEYDLAKLNMQSLFAMQRRDGFVGHMMFWTGMLPRSKMDLLQSRPHPHQLLPHMSALIQPSFAAQAVLRIYEGTNDHEFLVHMLRKLKRYFHWLAKNRDFSGDGLISIITPFESGMDWKVSYDRVIGFAGGIADSDLYERIRSVDLRNFLNGYNLKKIYKQNYFIVKDVGMNAIYAKDLGAMAKLCEFAGDEEAGVFHRRAKKVTESILEKMYDKKLYAFFDIYGKDDTKSPVLTPTIFYPIVLPGIPDNIVERVLTKHLFNKKEFDVTYPIPSVAVNDPSFYPHESQFLWRGPSWAVFNWFLYGGLKERGYMKEAKLLRDAVKEMIEKGSFREYYNPSTGGGYGARDFTWSGLIVDMN